MRPAESLWSSPRAGRADVDALDLIAIFFPVGVASALFCTLWIRGFWRTALAAFLSNALFYQTILVFGLTLERTSFAIKGGDEIVEMLNGYTIIFSTFVALIAAAIGKLNARLKCFNIHVPSLMVAFPTSWLMVYLLVQLPSPLKAGPVWVVCLSAVFLTTVRIRIPKARAIA